MQLIYFRCVERGRTKCGKYWPAEEEDSVSYGHLTITNITCDVQTAFTSTLFELHNSKVSCVGFFLVIIQFGRELFRNISSRTNFVTSAKPTKKWNFRHETIFLTTPCGK